uniref:Uncharacterized protein n=1 Tax=Rhizophora mucronata TaxID=61149 RepID=A0A2P2NWD5_RHIMU
MYIIYADDIHLKSVKTD